MHRLVLAALIALIIPACQPRGAASAGADSTALLAAYEQYRQAWLHNDSAAALARISDDIHILISGTPEIVGKHATRELFLDEMAHYRHTAFTLEHHDVIVIGDHAIVIGTYDETEEPTKSGASLHNTGRYMTLWHNEGGEWRIVRYMLNDLPAAHP